MELAWSLTHMRSGECSWAWTKGSQSDKAVSALVRGATSGFMMVSGNQRSELHLGLFAAL